MITTLRDSRVRSVQCRTAASRGNYICALRQRTPADITPAAAAASRRALPSLPFPNPAVSIQTVEKWSMRHSLLFKGKSCRSVGHES